jgi:hypothetical protein
MSRHSLRTLGVLAASGAASVGTALVPVALAASSAGASPSLSGKGLTATTVLVGNSLSHTFTDVNTGMPASETLSHPDDVTQLGFDVFVGFQNGVGPQGQANSNGNEDSTIVEMTPFGKEVAQWDIQGKADGVTADPAANLVVATVNEDASSSLDTITPGAADAVHYTYDKPLPHNGGTDGISVLGGRLIISASAPGTTGTIAPPSKTFPAAYWVSLNPSTAVATVKATFYDEAAARVANTNATNFGKRVDLALTDPDSSEIVPLGMRFGGQYMLDSQGDQQQIFLGNPAGRDHELSVLNLSQAVDDTAFPTDHGTQGELFATDSAYNNVDVIRGAFPFGPVAVATPCGANSAPPTCSTPNYLATIDPWTGQVNPLSVGGAAFVPQGGLLYVALPNP